MFRPWATNMSHLNDSLAQNVNGAKRLPSDIEMIQMDEINEAYECMLKGDVKYRFVFVCANLVVWLSTHPS
jgi:hypothetical protein